MAEQRVEGQTSKARDEMNEVLEEIKFLREDVKQKVGEGLQGLSVAAGRISAEVISELEGFHTQVCRNLTTPETRANVNQAAYIVQLAWSRFQEHLRGAYKTS